MSLLKVFLTVHGVDFDGAAFLHSLPPDLKGEMSEALQDKLNHSKLKVQHWRSRTLESEGPQADCDALILEILHAYKPSLESLARHTKETQVTCNIGVHYRSIDDVHGFWFSADCLSALARLKVELDIDAYGYTLGRAIQKDCQSKKTGD